MFLPDFELLRPHSVEEAVNALDEDYLPIAGGTELLLAMKLGLSAPAGLVNLGRIKSLSTLSTHGNELVIGSLVTHARIGTDPAVRAGCPLLADVEGTVGNPRVRAQGTIGGNLCFAEPKSDVATALMALDARVVLQGTAGRREMAVEDFVVGPYMTARRDDELMTEVRIPLTTGGVRTAYRKAQTMERPTVGVAAVAAPSHVTIVVGAIGVTPVRTDFESLAAVDVDAIVDRLKPMPDLTGSAAYKSHVAGVQIRRVLEAVA